MTYTRPSSDKCTETTVPSCKRDDVPRKNTTYERARFNQIVQQASESVALAENCSYGTLHYELIRDRPVVP